MTNRMKSVLLVTLQFLLIGLLLAGASWSATVFPVKMAMLSAIVLALWAALCMSQSKLRISPEPATAAILITNGPYRWLRHPMYTSILLFGAGLLYGNFTMLRLMLLICLLLLLTVKLRWEEKMLLEKFDSYKAYMKNTAALFPFVF